MTAAVVALLASIAQSPAAAPPQHERPIAIAAPGPQRLAPDAALLAGAAPFTVSRRGTTDRFIAEHGLSDLRLFASDGREVPYILVYRRIAEPEWLDAAVQPLAPTKKTSGFEADLGSPRNVDGLRIDGLPGSFLKRFTLEASGDRQHWTLVVPEGTLFDLPEQKLRQTIATFPPGPYRYLRFTWDDANSGRVPPPTTVWVRLASEQKPTAPTIVPAQFERRPSEPRRSRYHVTLPAARLPAIALRLEARGTYVFRSASVTEPRLTTWQAEPATIGRAALVRSTPGGPLVMPILQPSQRELDLLIEDEANAPLDLTSVAAELAELPWIYFDPSASSGSSQAPSRGEASGPVIARYGDPALAAPVYDLEAARPSIDIDRVPQAHWASAEAAPSSAAESPSLTADSMPVTGGATLDVSAFRYSRAIAGGPAALVAVPLDAAVLAHSSGPAGRFGDLRIVDTSGRQIPSLIEHGPEPLPLSVHAERVTPRAPQLRSGPSGSLSVYRLALPYPHLPDASILVTTPARVFRRHVQLGYERAADRRHRDPWFDEFTSVVWQNADQTTPAPLLSVPLQSSDATDLTLVVDEGDNSPLPIGSVQVLLPTYRLRFFRPASTSIRLVYGNDQIGQPNYDLALLAARVLGAAATPGVVDAESARPSSPGDRLVSPWAFWALIVVAVAVLLCVLLMLIRPSPGRESQL